MDRSRPPTPDAPNFMHTLLLFCASCKHEHKHTPSRPVHGGAQGGAFMRAHFYACVCVCLCVWTCVCGRVCVDVCVCAPPHYVRVMLRFLGLDVQPVGGRRGAPRGGGGGGDGGLGRGGDRPPRAGRRRRRLRRETFRHFPRVGPRIHDLVFSLLWLYCVSSAIRILE